jgi:hypothetical protein
MNFPSTVEEVLKEIAKLKLDFIPNQNAPEIDCIVPIPPQVRTDVYNMSYQALKNTLEYCINKLSIKFKLIIISGGKYHSYIQVVPKHSPKEYLRFLRNLNPGLKWPKTFTYKKQKFYVDKNVYKKQNLRFMNCIVSEVEPMTEEDLFYIKRIKVVSERYELPDGIYLLSTTDLLILRKDGKEPWVDVVGGEKNLFSHNYKEFIPIFNGNSDVKYLDIPIPNFEDLQYIWKKEAFQISESSWSGKINKAVFRGSASGCGFTIKTNPRLKAVMISRKYPQLLDAQITAMKEKLKIDEKEGVGYTDLTKLGISLGKGMTPQEQSRYKYILHLDGNVAAHRMAKWFLLNSVMLLQESGSRVWFQHMLEPYVHYIPIKKDLSDLIEKIQWCRDNDDKCKEIAQTAYKLGKQLLTEETCFSYIAKVFWASRF